MIVNFHDPLTESKRPKYRDDYRYERAFDAFYKLHPEAVDWHQARIRCEAEGTELIVPANLDEADSVPLLIAPILTKYEGVYVGIHDLYSERTFVTINGEYFNTYSYYSHCRRTHSNWLSSCGVKE